MWRAIVGWLLAIFSKPPPSRPVVRPAPTVPKPAPAQDVYWVDVCLPFTKQWEGCRLTAYLDTLAKPPVWTVGYGATGPDIVEGTMWTQAEADADLRRRLVKIGLAIASRTTGLSANQLSALADFAYNEGFTRLAESDIFVHLAAGDKAAATAEMLLYDKAGGVALQGLENRRRAEVALFNS